AMQRGGTTMYYNADGLGSVTSLTNAAGTISGTYTYSSFGQTASTASIANPYQYTGRENDPETGLYYYRARYYDPAIGRFLSEDPLRFRSGSDFYGYVENSAVNLIDPSGLAKCKDIAGLAGADTDAGLLARLIYFESTGSDMFVRNYNAIEGPTIPIDMAYDLERNAVAATVFNRINYVATHASSGGFSQHGATIAGVIGAKNGYQGMYDDQGNVHISRGNQARLNNTLNSACDSRDCGDLLYAIYVANQWLSGAGVDPFGSTIGMYAASGKPQGNYRPFAQIPGSGNIFYWWPND
ncbi:MAG TPA: RHS repeat-associated core domain-containing protein, partial [Candidatus Paceibacterota bacterium]